MVEFLAGRVSAQAYAQRRDAATAEQLARLTASSAFRAWKLSQAASDNRARVISNALVVAGCVLLVMTLALLKPAATVRRCGAAPCSCQTVGVPLHHHSYCLLAAAGHA